MRRRWEWLGLILLAGVGACQKPTDPVAAAKAVDLSLIVRLQEAARNEHNALVAANKDRAQSPEWFMLVTDARRHVRDADRLAAKDAARFDISKAYAAATAKAADEIKARLNVDADQVAYYMAQADAEDAAYAISPEAGPAGQRQKTVVAAIQKVVDGLVQQETIRALTPDFLTIKITWQARLRAAEIVAANSREERIAAAEKCLEAARRTLKQISSSLYMDGDGGAWIFAKYWLAETRWFVERESGKRPAEEFDPSATAAPRAGLLTDEAGASDADHSAAGAVVGAARDVMVVLGRLQPVKPLEPEFVGLVRDSSLRLRAAEFIAAGNHAQKTGAASKCLQRAKALQADVTKRLKIDANGVSQAIADYAVIEAEFTLAKTELERD